MMAQRDHNGVEECQSACENIDKTGRMKIMSEEINFNEPFQVLCPSCAEVTRTVSLEKLRA